MSELDMAMFEGLSVVFIERTITQKWHHGFGPTTSEEVEVDVDGAFSVDKAIEQFAQHGYGMARISSGRVTHIELRKLSQLGEG